LSERGYICLDRGALNHEFFEREQYSEFEAWVWLLTEAAWKKRFRRVGDYTANLERGQLIASVRFLAEKWGWKKTKVERFLNRLKTETMIGTASGTGITIITICNYDKYQLVGDATGTDAGQNPGQIRDRCGTDAGQYKEIKHLNIETVVGGANAPSSEKKSRKRASGLPAEFPMTDEHREYASKHGFKAKVGNHFAGERDGPAVEMFEAFKNHHIAKGSTMVDWDAAWRTWVNKQASWAATRPMLQMVKTRGLGL
jgi:hypothetical protein